MITMKRRLARLPYWQIAALGITVTLALLALITAGAIVLYITYPAAVGWGLPAQMLAAFAIGRYVPAPFITAYRDKWVRERVDAAMERLMGALGEMDSNA